jgi:hypothetical protein
METLVVRLTTLCAEMKKKNGENVQFAVLLLHWYHGVGLVILFLDTITRFGRPSFDSFAP